MTAQILSEGVCGLPKLYWQESPNVYSPHSIHGPLDPRLIVFHDLECDYQEGINTFLDSRPGDNHVSAHLVLKEDGSEATQMVRFGTIAWHVVQFNRIAIGLEIGGYLAKGYAPDELGAAERIIAYLLHRFNLPPVWSKDGSVPGFCRHRDLGAAGGGHSDPMADGPIWDAFIKSVQAAYTAGDWPKYPWGLP